MVGAPLAFFPASKTRDAACISQPFTENEMLREFTDTAGTTWQVWDVYPIGRSKLSDPAAPDPTPSLPAYPHRDLGEGWLCFQSDHEKRRLAPIPPDWEICECATLEQLCTSAGYISRAKALEDQDRDVVS